MEELLANHEDHARQHESLITALAASHPSLQPQQNLLLPALDRTFDLANRVNQRQSHLLALRQQTQDHLHRSHAMERQWRSKQAQAERELDPWSAKSLYQRLREAERTGEEISTAMEQSWLDEHGQVGERELSDWIRGYRDDRARLCMRREFRQRWDEGRVGGWR